MLSVCVSQRTCAGALWLLLLLLTVPLVDTATRPSYIDTACGSTADCPDSPLSTTSGLGTSVRQLFANDFSRAYNAIIFRKCCNRCRFQPYDCVIIRLRGVDSVCLQILLMGTCRLYGSWSVLATITGRWLGETPFVQVSTTWALTCPETVHQRLCMTREIETWLSDSRVGNNSVVDQSSLRCIVVVLTDKNKTNSITW